MANVVAYKTLQVINGATGATGAAALHTNANFVTIADSLETLTNNKLSAISGDSNPSLGGNLALNNRAISLDVSGLRVGTNTVYNSGFAYGTGNIVSGLHSVGVGTNNITYTNYNIACGSGARATQYNEHVCSNGLVPNTNYLNQYSTLQLKGSTTGLIPVNLKLDDTTEIVFNRVANSGQHISLECNIFCWESGTANYVNEKYNIVYNNIGGILSPLNQTVIYNNTACTTNITTASGSRNHDTIRVTVTPSGLTNRLLCSAVLHVHGFYQFP